MRWIACVLSVLLAYCPAFAKASTGKPAPTEEPTTRPATAAEATTRPAKIAITPGKDTTVILGPLNEDGTVNYVAALNAELSRGVTPENNAMIPLLKAFGAEALLPDKTHRQMALARLGLKRLPKSDRPFFPLDDFVQKRWAGPDANETQVEALDKQAYESVNQASRAPWSAKQRPAIAAWLEANDKALEHVVGATNRPRCYLPMVSTDQPPSLMFIQSWELPAFLEASAALAARATYRAGSGNVGGACSDLLAVHRLARLTARGPGRVNFLLGVCAEYIACDADVAVAASGRLSLARARAHLAALRALSPLRRITEEVDRAGRFAALDGVMDVARETPNLPMILWSPWGLWMDLSFEAANVGGLERDLALLLRRLDAQGEPPALRVDWNETLRTVNRKYDRMAAICGIDDIVERKRQQDSFVRDIEETAKRCKDVLASKEKFAELLKLGRPGEPDAKASGQMIGNLIVSVLVTSASDAMKVTQEAEVRLDLARLSMALAVCKAETGRYAARLAELAPKIVPEIPADRFGGKPLIYKPSKGGDGYVLYSIGMDLKDDGGKDNRDSKSGDGDIVARTP